MPENKWKTMKGNKISHYFGSYIDDLTLCGTRPSVTPKIGKVYEDEAVEEKCNLCQDMLKKRIEKRFPPTICIDKKCECLLNQQDRLMWDNGHSFNCWGRIDPHRFTGDGFTHNNDLSHCIYTPGKGMMRFYENTDDQYLAIRDLIALLPRIGVEKLNLGWLFRGEIQEELRIKLQDDMIIHFEKDK